MRTGIQLRRVLGGFLATAAIISLFGGTDASAQRFQYAYGSPGCIETGLHGVKQRAIGGYVGVGESFAMVGGCGTSDPYVVVTNAAGAQIWSNTYQLGTNGRATDVLELPNGELIVCGYTTIGPPCQAVASNDIFVLRLNAGGGIINYATYGGSGTQEEAWKIVRTQVGDGVTTFAGDYVIAGSSTNQNAPGMRGGYLLRINAGLVLIWDRQYGTSANDDYFYGVDEVRPGLAGAGDIVAAGGSTSPPAIGIDIFVCRVNGNSGAIGGAPQGQSWTNFPNPVASNDEARSVRVLRNGQNAGDIVVAGYTTGSPMPSVNDEVFVVEFTANPCVQVANIAFGDNGPNADRGTDLIEDANPVPAGGSDVMVTGFAQVPPGFGGRDVFLQRVSTGPGMALVGAGGIYGGIGADEGGAVGNAVRNVAGAETPGYIVNGFTQSANLIGAADPRQLYLIKTDVGLNSFCNWLLFQFPNRRAQNGTVCGTALGPNINLQCKPVIGFITWQWGNQLCYFFPRAQQGGNENDGVAGVGNAATLTFGEGRMTSYPNPLRSGDALNLRFEFGAATTAHVVVSDIVGRETWRNDVSVEKGNVVVPVSTDRWAAGTYLVRVTVGDVTETAHVVVLEK